MKVLIINDIGSEMGGAEVVIEQIKDGMRSIGHEVKVLSGDEYPRDRHINDYEFRSHTSNKPLDNLMYCYNPFSRITLKKILKEFKPDVVHLHNTSKASPSILFCLKNYPTVMTTHDFEVLDQSRFADFESLIPYTNYYDQYFVMKKGVKFYAQKLRYVLIRQGQKNINTFVTPSLAISKLLREGGITSNAVVIHNGKDLQSPKKAIIYRSNPYQILFVGRLVREKGLDVLLYAISEVIKKLPHVRLRIVGDGPEQEKLISLSKKLELHEHVEFTGTISQKDIEKKYMETDIVVVPSTWYEPLGIVVIEAMLHGKPVIASRSGGLPEMVEENVTGFLFEPGNAQQLAKLIIKLINSPNTIEKFGRKSLYASRKFSSEVFIEKMINVYNSTISDNKTK
jgi:glycosyltransferase involved in cell wall biosynthesis